MDDLFYNFAYILIAIQILLSGIVVVLGVGQLAVLALRQTDDGERIMSDLNLIAYNGFTLGVGIILMTFLLNGTVEPWLLLGASSLAGSLKLAVDYFYRKRVPSIDPTQTENRELHDGGTHAFADEIDRLSHKEKQQESTTDKM